MEPRRDGRCMAADGASGGSLDGIPGNAKWKYGNLHNISTVVQTLESGQMNSHQLSYFEALADFIIIIMAIYPNTAMLEIEH